MTKKSAEELISRIIAGDDLAFEELVRRYKMKVYSIAYSIIRNREDAEEAAQDVFIILYQKLKGFKKKSSFETWLYRIVVNRAKDYYRKGKRRHRDVSLNSSDTAENGELGDTFSAPNSDVEEQIYQEQLQSKLARALEKLPVKYRTVFVLREQQGLSYKEIAKVLRVREGNVKVLLFRARNKLLEILKEEEGTNEVH